MNKLTLNAKKTKSMLFGSRQRLSMTDSRLNIHINGEDLEHVTSFKYLGLWFDPVLNWKAHTDHICRKIAQRIGIQARVRSFISETSANTLYISMIAPIMTFGDIVWTKGPKENTDRVQRLQNRAGRVILRWKHRSHVADIHRKLGWLTCNQNFKLHEALMVGKCLFGRVPSYLRGKFMYARDFHSHSTRHSNSKLFVPRVNCSAAKNLFCYHGALLFNSLPTNIQLCADFKTYKAKCVEYFTVN